MKRQRLFLRILLPAMAAVLALAPLTCLVFRQAAQGYAYQQAEEGLRGLQQSVLPLMDSAFGTARTGTPQEQNRVFLRGVSALVRKTGGSASLMILGPRMNMIYPHVEEEREAAQPLAAVCAAYIASADGSTGEAARLTGPEGEGYLAAFYQVPSKTSQIQYLVTYCPVAQIGAWVDQAGRIVLAVTLALALLTVALLGIVAQSITHPLHRLCRGAEAIGRGGFEAIEPAFSLLELEELRLSMNDTAQRLRRAEQVQRDFFQNVSHELRNPLMSISGYAQGIEKGIFASPQVAAHTILEESGRLTELVGSLLTLSRIEGEEAPARLEALRISEPIEDCLDRVSGQALAKGVTLALAPFEESLCVWGEEELVGRVLENLLTNAVRYAQTAVTLSVAREGGRVSVQVADDGGGIAAKDLPHLFERCYKGAGGNFGIGLAIARSAAQRMGGSLRAANRAEGGAVFTLELHGAGPETPGIAGRLAEA